MNLPFFLPPNLAHLSDEFDVHFSNFAGTMSEIDEMATSDLAKAKFHEAVSFLSWKAEEGKDEASKEGKDEAPEVPEEGKYEAPEEGKGEASKEGEDDAVKGEDYAAIKPTTVTPGDGDEDEGEEGRRIEVQVR